MKKWKLAFGLSLIVNIVLAYWAFRQRTTILETERRNQQEAASLKQVGNELETMHSQLKELGDRQNIQLLRRIASNDQLEAFLTERGYYVEID